MNKLILLCFMSIFSAPLSAMEGLRITIPEKPSLCCVSCMQEIITSITTYLDTLSAPEQAVAIIDLDFTLFMANIPQGHPRFFKALVRFLQETRKIGKDDAHNQVLMEIFSADQALTTIQRDGHDEGSDAHRLIQLFHDRNIPVFAVTARSTILSRQTMTALSNLGFTFTMPEQCTHSEFNQETYPYLNDKTCFCNGVLFCGKNPKGSLVHLFLRHYNLKPTTIFAVDDDPGNLENIAHALRVLPAQTKAYRYGFLDPETQDFELTDAIIPRWAREIPPNVLSFEQFPEIGSPLTSPGPSSYPAISYHKHIPRPETHE